MHRARRPPGRTEWRGSRRRPGSRSTAQSCRGRSGKNVVSSARVWDEWRRHGGGGGGSSSQQPAASSQQPAASSRQPAASSSIFRSMVNNSTRRQRHHASSSLKHCRLVNVPVEGSVLVCAASAAGAAGRRRSEKRQERRGQLSPAGGHTSKARSPPSGSQDSSRIGTRNRAPASGRRDNSWHPRVSEQLAGCEPHQDGSRVAERVRSSIGIPLGSAAAGCRAAAVRSIVVVTSRGAGARVGLRRRVASASRRTESAWQLTSLC